MRYFSILFLLPFLSFGQVEIYYQETLLEDNDTVVFISTELPITQTVFGEAISIKNASNEIQHVKVFREELSMIDGAESQICWGSFCYGPAVVSSIESLPIAPGGFQETFKAYYLPNNNLGRSDIKFTFLDTLSGEEVSLVTRFKVLQLILPNTDLANVTVYPNPFLSMVSINDLPIDTSCKIYDYHGQLVYQGVQSEIDLSFLRKGMYVLMLDDSRVIKLQKF